MRLGLVTIYNVPNFGSALQAYATQCILEQLGHECKIIQYKYPNELQKTVKPDFKSILYSWTSRFGLVSQQRKSNKLRKFREENYNFTKPYNSFIELKEENWDSYDGFVIGSDQVWKALYTKGEPAFTLSFAPDEKKRFSFASSFASDYLPEIYEDTFKAELQKFSALSVRENEGIEIITRQLGLDKNVFVCLDPTLLLNKEQWLQLSSKSKKDVQEPYILYYMWAYAFEPRPYINNVVEYFRGKTGINTVIALEGAPKSSIHGVHYINKEDSSIPEFLELFANAALVITSSFHGTAFAINMGVPLISIIPDNEKDSRQRSLLKSVGAENCVVKLNQDVDSINPYYNRESISSKLELLRGYCFKWLEDNIK